jgi:hypothetical protein
VEIDIDRADGGGTLAAQLPSRHCFYAHNDLTLGKSRREPYISSELSTKIRRLRSFGKCVKARIGLSKSQCG